MRIFFERAMSRRAGKLPVFAAVFGDSAVDDEMFATAYKVIGESMPSACPHELAAFTVNVGRRSGNASAYVTDVKDVENILSTLADSKSTVAGSAVDEVAARINSLSVL